MAGQRKPIKTIILGAEKTGKTALVKKYIHSTFTEDYDPSFEGTDLKQLVIEGQAYTLDLIPAEPAGENLLCQTGEAFILLYAINNRKSFQHILQLHDQIKQAKGGSLSKFPIFLVGNKADLESGRQVSLEEGRQIAIQLRCQKLFEISSKAHVAEINDMFDKLVRETIHNEQSTSNPVRPPMTPLSKSQPLMTNIRQSQEPMSSISPTSLTSPTSDSPRRSGMFDRLKFGSLKRKASFQSLTRKKSGSFTQSIMSTDSARPSSNNLRSVSYGNTLSTPNRPSNVTTSTPSPYRLDIDTSSWRETVKWPTEIIPEEDTKMK